MVELKDNTKGQFEAVVMIELARIYDLLSIIANAADPGRLESIMEMHKIGKLNAPPPAMVVEVDDDN